MCIPRNERVLHPERGRRALSDVRWRRHPIRRCHATWTDCNRIRVSAINAGRVVGGNGWGRRTWGGIVLYKIPSKVISTSPLYSSSTKLVLIHETTNTTRLHLGDVREDEVGTVTLMNHSRGFLACLAAVSRLRDGVCHHGRKWRKAMAGDGVGMPSWLKMAYDMTPWPRGAEERGGVGCAWEGGADRGHRLGGGVCGFWPQCPQQMPSAVGDGSPVSKLLSPASSSWLCKAKPPPPSDTPQYID